MTAQHPASDKQRVFGPLSAPTFLHDAASISTSVAACHVPGNKPKLLVHMRRVESTKIQTQCRKALQVVDNVDRLTPLAASAATM